MSRSICMCTGARPADYQDSAFGVAVTILTLGGLLGTLAGDWGTRRFGRVGLLRVSEVLFAVGTALVGLTNRLAPLIMGRYATSFR
jgi:predicted MFS family arabinose efflux permease